MWLHIFLSDPLRNILDVSVLWVLIYYVVKVLRGTRAMQVLQGLLLLLGLSVFARWASLYTINWVLDNFWPVLLISLVILFHPEIRRLLAGIGRRSLFRTLLRDQSETVEIVVKAASLLSKKHIGALVAFEREGSLQRFVDTGVQIDGMVNADLLTTIFTPHTPLHDGAVVIQGDRISAAACLFPLTERELADKSLGTRHRAAIGLTEEVDAIVVVISEETGTISVAIGGRLTRDLDPAQLRHILTRLFHRR
ncbi:MAG TPA: diadenylate cyclase CdaA [bacterium]|nr:diadenylate cyclase CdaA [bacterium]